MLLVSHPFSTRSSAEAVLAPAIRIATRAPCIGIAASGRRVERRPGESVIRGLDHYIDSHLDANAPGTGHRDGKVGVGGLGHYIDNRLGDGRFRIS